MKKIGILILLLSLFAIASCKLEFVPEEHPKGKGSCPEIVEHIN